jgi:hypothetical protein
MQMSSNEGFEVVRGNPTPEELAVVLAVLQAASQKAKAAQADSIRQVSTWSKNPSQLRSPLVPGRGQWQAAFRRGLSR